jgi:hypothetical protein
MFTSVCCEPDCNSYILNHAVLVVGYGTDKSIFKSTGWSRIRGTQARLRKVTYGWLTTDKKLWYCQYAKLSTGLIKFSTII